MVLDTLPLSHELKQFKCIPQTPHSYSLSHTASKRFRYRSAPFSIARSRFAWSVSLSFSVFYLSLFFSLSLSFSTALFVSSLSAYRRLVYTLVAMHRLTSALRANVAMMIIPLDAEESGNGWQRDGRLPSFWVNTHSWTVDCGRNSPTGRSDTR